MEHERAQLRDVCTCFLCSDVEHEDRGRERPIRCTCMFTPLSAADAEYVASRTHAGELNAATCGAHEHGVAEVLHPKCARR